MARLKLLDGFLCPMVTILGWHLHFEQERDMLSTTVVRLLLTAAKNRHIYHGALPFDSGCQG